MAANFQQMGGPGQMIPQQQQQQRQQQGQQQRPNQNASGPTAHIQQIIFQSINTNTGPLTGWQAGVLVQERISLIFNMSVLSRRSLTPRLFLRFAQILNSD